MNYTHYDQPTVTDVVAAQTGDFCPWCGDDEPVRAQLGPRRRCLGCGARWKDLGPGLVEPEPVTEQAAKPAEPVQLTLPPKPKPQPRTRDTDRVAREIEDFLKQRQGGK